jgi:tRNA G37 N-methylase Trm5
LHNFLPDKTITSHKKEIKQYIFDFDKNMEFLINKKKQVSIGFDLVDGMQRNKFTKPLYWDKNWIGYSWNDQDLDVNIEKMLHNYKG